MNLLIHLRFLRPLRSLAFVGLCTGSALLWVRHLDASAARLIVLTIALPFLLGSCLAGAAQEPLHHPGALVLPDIRRRQRTIAGVSSLLAALVVAGVTSWVASGVSRFAILGLVCTFMALPCLDRHQWLGGHRGFPVIFGWAFLCPTVGPELAWAMNTAPWLFLIGGLSVAVTSLVKGFSRASLRVRAGIPFTAYQAWSGLFHARSASWRKERVAASAPGRDWTVRSVGRDTWSWMRVFWHATYRGSYLKNPLILVFGLVFYVMLLPVLTFITTPPEATGSFTIAGYYWDRLASLGAFDPVWDKLKGILMFLQVVFCVLLSLALPPPQPICPISRQRLADVAFGLSLVQFGLAFLLPALSPFLPCLLGQIMSGHLLPDLGLPALSTLSLGLLPLLPLLACAALGRTSAGRILLGLPVAIAIVPIAITRVSWHHWILTLPGLATVAITTTATLLLLRWRLRQHYRTGDLILDSDQLSPTAT